MVEIEPELYDLPDEVARRLSAFVGRDRAFIDAASWLSSGRRRLIIVGPPGSGKSLFAGRLVSLWPACFPGAVAVQDGAALQTVLGAWHFFQSGRDRTLTPGRLVERIIDHLSRSLDGFADALQEAALQPPRSPTVSGEVHVAGSVTGSAHVSGVSVTVSVDGGVAGAVNAFDSWVRSPLTKLAAAGRLPTAVVIILDGLDEVFSTPLGDAALAFIARVTGPECDLPLQVRFIVTSRPDRRVERLVGPADLIFGDTADLEDVTAYARRELVQSYGLLHADRLADRLARSGKFNFLYVRYMLAEATVCDDYHLPDLPAGLDGHYRAFLARELTRGHEAWEERYRPVLSILSAAVGDGFTAEEIAGITAIPRYRVDDSLLRLTPYLLENSQGRWRIYHYSFMNFLADETMFPVYRDEADHAIIDWYRSKHDGQWLEPGAAGYATSALAANAARAGRLDELISQPSFLTAVDFDELAAATAHYRPSRGSLHALIRSDVRRMRDLPPTERLAYLEMTADQVGASEMAGQLRRLNLPRPWSVRWSSWNSSDSRVVGSHDARIRHVVAVNHHGRATAICIDNDGELRCWDVMTGGISGPAILAPAETYNFSVAYQAGDLVALAQDRQAGEIRTWNLESGAAAGAIAAPGNLSSVLAIQVEGRLVLLAGYHSGAASIGYLDGNLQTVRLPASDFRPFSTKQAVGQLGGKPIAVHVRIASDSFAIDLVDLVTMSLVKTFDCRPYTGGDDVEYAAVVTLDGTAAVVAAFTNYEMKTDLKAWRLHDGALVWSASVDTEHVPFVAAGQTTDGVAVAVTADMDELVVFRVGGSSASHQTLRNNGGAVSALTVAEIDRRLLVVTGGTDGKLRAWDMPPGTDAPDAGAEPGQYGLVSALATEGGALGSVVAVRQAAADTPAWLVGHAARDGKQDFGLALPEVGELCSYRIDGSPAIAIVGEAGIAIARASRTGEAASLELRLCWLRRLSYRGDSIPVRYAVSAPLGRPVFAVGHEGPDVRGNGDVLGVETFDLQTGRLLGPRAGTDRPGRIALGAFGTRLVVAYEAFNNRKMRSTVSVWDVGTGDPVGPAVEMTSGPRHNFFGLEVVNLMVHDAGGTPAVVASNRFGEVRLWNPHSTKSAILFQPHTGTVPAAVFVTGGENSCLVTGDTGGSLRLWQLTGELIHRIDVGSPITAMANVDEREVAVATKAGLLVVEFSHALVANP